MYSLVGREFINRFKSFYPKLKVASGGTEVVARCPYCGDSKDQNHAHLYISVPNTEQDIVLYHCKKCPASGIVDADFLRKLECDDAGFIIELTRHNNDVLSLPKYQTIKKIDVYPLHLSYIRNDKCNPAKLYYINNRLGSNFTAEQLLSLKVFLNLYDVINSNRLLISRNKNVCDLLDAYFIGFISYDNSYAGMRKLTNIELPIKSVNKRYINYTLVDKLDDKKNYYVIPTNVDIMSNDVVKIHIAEGQFDILSIYYNLNKCNNFQNIYIACGGKSYYQTLEFILTETGIINYELHFYPDIDVSDEEFRYSVLNIIEYLPCEIYVHRNVYPNEKDYGVPMDRINDYVVRVH